MANPSESLLIGKPTRDAAEQAEAQNDRTMRAHMVVVRFEAGSSDCQSPLGRLNGARLQGAAERAAR